MRTCSPSPLPHNGVQSIPVPAGVEAELADLDPEEAAEYLESLDFREFGLETLAQAACCYFGLQSYFTAGPMEVSVTVRTALRPPRHPPDFERGFHQVEVASYNDCRAGRRGWLQDWAWQATHRGQGVRGRGRRRHALPL